MFKDLIVRTVDTSRSVVLCRSCFSVEFPFNLLFREFLGLLPQHVGQLFLTHANLLSNWHDAVCEVIVVFSQQAIGYHEVVYVLKDKGVARRIGCFGGKKGTWMVAPVPERVKVVGGMPTVIKTVSIALNQIYLSAHTQAAGIFSSIQA